MLNTNHTDGRTTRWIRWTARGIGAFVAGYCLLMGVVYGISEPGPETWEDWVMAGLIITSVLGVLIAWRRERIGGTILVICAVAHSTFAYIAAGHNKGFAMLISGGPFLLIGALFLTSWHKSDR